MVAPVAALPPLLDPEALGATRAAPVMATPERLLWVAERLFAERGIEAVPTRAVTAAAGANAAAIHYHFGSKAALVRAILERRMGEVKRARDLMLADLDQRSTVTVRDVAAAWVWPLAEMALDPTGERCAYPGFLARLHASAPEYRDLATELFRPSFARIDALLARALPTSEVEVRRFRFALAVDAASAALSDLGRSGGAWRAGGGSIAARELIEHIVDALAGMLSGPPGGPALERPSTRRRKS